MKMIKTKIEKKRERDICTVRKMERIQSKLPKNTKARQRSKPILIGLSSQGTDKTLVFT